MKKLLLLAVCAAFFAGAARAQTAPDTLAVTLEDAIVRALAQSEEVKLAQSELLLAETQVTTARAAALPQISSALGYTRTLASVFDVGTPAMPDSLLFRPNPDAPLLDRLSYLEQRSPNAALGALGQVFGNLPFGRENTYLFNVSGSQVLYAGGRVRSALRIARNYRQAATHQYREARADLELEVREAYYHALLAQEMVSISEAAVAQAERFLADERLRLQAGRAADLEIMRAEVALENLRPQLVQAQNGRELALLNLKRLLNVPTSVPMRLTQRLDAPLADEAYAPAGLEDRYEQRDAVKALEQAVEMRRHAVRVAKGDYLPSIALSTSYAKQLYPSSVVALNEDWRTDWSVSLGISFNVFDGLKRSAGVQQAQVAYEQAQLQLDQLREGVQLQYEQARGERERSLSQMAARKRTIEQAQRVYDLTLMRYEKGLATQLEVNDARLALLQARTFLAQAQADYHLADSQLLRAIGAF